MEKQKVTATSLLTTLTQKRNNLEGLDEWLEDHLTHCFSLAAAGEAVKVSWQHVHLRRWAHHAFVLEMVDRGFEVTFKEAPSRSAKNINRGWYLIRLPMDHLSIPVEALKESDKGAAA